MARGIDVSGDQYKLRRLQAWYVEEMLQDFHKTMLIATASREGSTGHDLQELVRKYRESLFPTGKTNEQLIEKYQELLSSQEGKVLGVRALDT
jgi:hypothetical protein